MVGIKQGTVEKDKFTVSYLDLNHGSSTSSIEITSSVGVITQNLSTSSFQHKSVFLFFLFFFPEVTEIFLAYFYTGFLATYWDRKVYTPISVNFTTTGSKILGK